MKGPRLSEDVRNVVLIGGAAFVGLVGTAGLMVASFAGVSSNIEIRRSIERVPVVIENPVDGTNRIWGTVTTRSGDTHAGFIRWDQNEGAWADLLDGNKVTDSSVRQAGIRFGNISRLDILDGSSADITLRDGSVVEMQGASTDLGSGLRSLIVVNPEAGSSEYRWGDLESIEFSAAPQGMMAGESRLHGTLTTRDGQEFTGYVAWDADEIYSSDVLDGEYDGTDYEIAFGNIEEIHQGGSSSARVLLSDGRELTLSGTNDVDSDNRGISVSDPSLGQVLVQWNDFGSVRFHEAEQETGFASFEQTGPLVGTLITEMGDRLAGSIQWDRDESSAWEVLNGDANGIEFSIEMGKVARIQKVSGGAEVELLDGRIFQVSGSNDVNSDNNGIVVTADGVEQVIGWDNFRSIRFGG